MEKVYLSITCKNFNMAERQFRPQQTKDYTGH